jgi:hypothetical protein
MRIVATAAVLLLAMTACNRGQRHEAANAAPVTPAPIGFQHEAGFDAQGYYRPQQAVAQGQLRLTSIAVGAPSDFEAWEGGKREEVFGPIVAEFEDQSSPMEDAANGQRRTVRLAVKPLAYRVGPGAFSFHGHDDKLGDVDFDGAFDTPALAAAKAGAGGEAKPVLTGALTLGQQHIPGLKFSYQSGD